MGRHQVRRQVQMKRLQGLAPVYITYHHYHQRLRRTEQVERQRHQGPQCRAPDLVLVTLVLVLVTLEWLLKEQNQGLQMPAMMCQGMGGSSGC